MEFAIVNGFETIEIILFQIANILNNINGL